MYSSEMTVSHVNLFQIEVIKYVLSKHKDGVGWQFQNSQQPQSRKDSRVEVSNRVLTQIQLFQLCEGWENSGFGDLGQVVLRHIQNLDFTQERVHKEVEVGQLVPGQVEPLQAVEEPEGHGLDPGDSVVGEVDDPEVVHPSEGDLLDARRVVVTQRQIFHALNVRKHPTLEFGQHVVLQMQRFKFAQSVEGSGQQHIQTVVWQVQLHQLVQVSEDVCREGGEAVVLELELVELDQRVEDPCAEGRDLVVVEFEPLERDHTSEGVERDLTDVVAEEVEVVEAREGPQRWRQGWYGRDHVVMETQELQTAQARQGVPVHRLKLVVPQVQMRQVVLQTLKCLLVHWCQIDSLEPQLFDVQSSEGVPLNPTDLRVVSEMQLFEEQQASVERRDSVDVTQVLAVDVVICVVLSPAVASADQCRTPGEVVTVHHVP